MYVFALMAQASRKDSVADTQKATREAEALHAAGEAQWGTDESEFLRLMCAESPAQLAAVFSAYEKLYGKKMEQVIESEFSGDIKDGLCALGTGPSTSTSTNRNRTRTRSFFCSITVLVHVGLLSFTFAADFLQYSTVHDIDKFLSEF